MNYLLGSHILVLSLSFLLRTFSIGSHGLLESINLPLSGSPRLRKKPLKSPGNTFKCRESGCACSRPSSPPIGIFLLPELIAGVVPHRHPHWTIFEMSTASVKEERQLAGLSSWQTPASFSEEKTGTGAGFLQERSYRPSVLSGTILCPSLSF